MEGLDPARERLRPAQGVSRGRGGPGQGDRNRSGRASSPLVDGQAPPDQGRQCRRREGLSRSCEEISGFSAGGAGNAQLLREDRPERQAPPMGCPKPGPDPGGSEAPGDGGRDLHRVGNGPSKPSPLSKRPCLRTPKTGCCTCSWAGSI